MEKQSKLPHSEQTTYMSPCAVFPVGTIVRFQCAGVRGSSWMRLCGDTRPSGMLHDTTSANVLCDSP